MTASVFCVLEDVERIYALTSSTSVISVRLPVVCIDGCSRTVYIVKVFGHVFAVDERQL